MGNKTQTKNKYEITRTLRDFIKYLEFKLYKSLGMYPSGETESVGGGNQITVKPKDDSSLALSLSSMYHFPDL